MVANVHKAKSRGANLKSSLDYDLAQGRHAKENQEKQPKIVISNNITGITSQEIKKEFKNISDQNTNKNFKNKEYHFSISFSPNDKTPNDKRIEAVDKSIQNFGVEKNNFQYIAVQHFDKNHPHFHVTVNKVGLDGKTLNIKNDFGKLEKALDRTEKEMKLDNSMAEKRKFIWNPNSQKGYDYQPKEQYEKNQIKKPREKSKTLEERKEFIQNKIDEALTISKVKSVEELKTELKKQNIDFAYTVNKNGLAGTSFKSEKLAVKGSQIDFKASKIDKQLKINEIAKSINSISDQPQKSKDNYFEKLKEQREKNQQNSEKKRGFRF